MSENTPRPSVKEWIGVYDADGGLFGELAYVLGSIFAGRACSLCDITHGWVREKRTFKAQREALDIPLTLLHLNEQSESLRAFTDGRAPCVVARWPDGFEMVFDAEALESMKGEGHVFFERLSRWQMDNARQ